MEDPEDRKLIGVWAFAQIVRAIMLYGGKYSKGLLDFVVPRPFSADIHVSTICNSRCITCNYWRPEARKNYAERDMTTEQIENILAQLRDIGIKIVGLGGAEPLMRKDIGELIKKAKDIVGGQVYLTTNGLLLERKAETIVENGIDHVSVSIDGIDETNDKIRGIPGDYEKAIKGIKKLKEMIAEKKTKECIINIGTTIMQSNIEEIPQLIDLAYRLGTRWSFNLLDNNNTFAKTLDLSQIFVKDRNAIDRIIDYLRNIPTEKQNTFTLDPNSLKYTAMYLKNKTPYEHCFLGYFRLYIDSHLNVYPGCIVLKPVGNLKESTLKTIVESELYKERARQMFNMECPGCTCGYPHNCMIEKLPMSVKYLFSKLSPYRRYF